MIKNHAVDFQYTSRSLYNRVRWLLLLLLLLPFLTWAAGAPTGGDEFDFPRSLESYGDADMAGIGERLVHRIKTQPFNVVATIIFLLAIVHTFMSSKFLEMAHRWDEEHKAKIAAGKAPRKSVSHRSELFHFLGEVEAVFGIWALALGIAVTIFYDWSTFVGYLSYRVDFTEAMFVVVIMALASTRPILWVAEDFMGRVAALLGGTLAAWWLVILTLGPVMGSFITEPAAMTICALLLARKFYDLGPNTKFKYATMGLLFVNISVGGTFTHFAAPPVLIVAGPWQWDTLFMLSQFGWKAGVGILVANGLYFILFRSELKQLQDKFMVRKLKDDIHKKYVSREMMEVRVDEIVALVDKEAQTTSSIKALIDADVARVRAQVEPEYLEYTASLGIDRQLAKSAFKERFEEVKLARLREDFPSLLPEEERAHLIDPNWDKRDDPVPIWVVLFHVLFLGWTILNAHHPPLFIAGLLFFLGFAVVTLPYQNRINLKPPLLVGFFLAGLVVHGGFQGWWIEPILGSLSAVPLKLTATVLTAFNDNAAITYLTTLIPNLSEELKIAVVSGAVAGGGLTVIANAPNPAGQSLLKSYFENGVSPLHLLAASITPTLIMLTTFFVLG